MYSGFVACFICCCISKLCTVVIVQTARIFSYWVVSLYQLNPYSLGAVSWIFFFNPFSAALRLPLEGGDEEWNTDYNSFMNIMFLNSDISRAGVRNEGERPGWRTTGLDLTGSRGNIQHDATSQVHLNFLLILCFLLLFFN